MKLSVESFQSIVSFIGSSAKPSETGERRKRPRMDIITGFATIRIRRQGQRDEAARVVVRDVSPEGIGISHSQPLRMGEQFVLHLPSDNGKSREILCTVMRWRPDGEKLFNIGAIFTQDISAPGVAA